MSTQLPAGLACICAVLAATGPALAQSGTAAPKPTAAVLFPEAAKAPRNWAVTISPIHLGLPLVEFTVERRIKRKLGVALMLGGGSLTDDLDNKFRVAEVGLSARYYVLGNFAKGMQIGGAIEFVSVKGDNVNGSSISVQGSGLVVAPFIGYKHTFGFGLTLDGQLGVGFTAIEAEADNGARAEESSVDAYLNLNIG